MPTETQIGNGTTLAYSTNLTTPAYTTLGLVVKVDGPAFKYEMIDAPLLSQTFKQKRPGAAEGEDSNFTIQYNSGETGVEAILTQLATRPPLVRFKLTFEDLGTAVWDGYLMSFKIAGLEAGGRVTAEVGYTINTVPVFVAAA